MKKLLITLILIVGLLVVPAVGVAQQHWETKASLVDGYYVISSWCPDEDGGSMTLCGKLFRVDHSNPWMNDDFVAWWLNDDPPSPPSNIIGLFKLDEEAGTWVKVDLPVRWISGVQM